MRKVLFFIICGFVNQYCFSQQKELDSLSNELKKHPQEDTQRLNLLNDIAYKYSYINAGKGLEVADSAIVLSQHLKNEEKLASAYRSKAANYYSQNDDAKAIDYYNKALVIYHQLNIKPKEGAVLQNIGLIYQKSNFFAALEYHQKALNVFEQINDTGNIANSYRSIGVDYQYLSQYSKALESLQKSLNAFEECQNKNGIAAVFGNIGIVYTYLENFP